MARPLRIEYDGALDHVTSRGNERKAIFKHDSDRKLFLDMLGQVNKRFHWICHAYCLMDNHYHLIIECSISLKGPTRFQGRGPLRSAERSDEGKGKGVGSLFRNVQTDRGAKRKWRRRCCLFVPCEIEPSGASNPTQRWFLCHCCAASACNFIPSALTTLRTVSKSGLRSPERAL